jgi:AcrR family transcriptional regulator
MDSIPQVRGERLVSKVVEATLRELSDVGYRALSIEVVAERAQVNKTTIYRRWPTKAALVRDALESIIDDVFASPDEGALRTDLVAFAKRIRDVAASPRGRGIFRVMAAESENEELASVMSHIRERSRPPLDAIVARATKRGELPKGSDAELLVSCVVAPVLNWVQMEGLVVSDARIEQVVALVLDGATHGGARTVRPLGAGTTKASRATRGARPPR